MSGTTLRKYGYWVASIDLEGGTTRGQIAHLRHPKLDTRQCIGSAAFPFNPTVFLVAYIFEKRTDTF